MTFTSALPVVVVDASSMVEVLAGDPAWIDRMERWQTRRALVLTPAHFAIEMADALLRGVRLDPLDAIARLQQLFRTGIEPVDRGLGGLFDSIELASRHGLTVYDAAYLQLALDVEGELATCDRALMQAAHAEGITLVA